MTTHATENNQQVASPTTATLAVRKPAHVKQVPMKMSQEQHSGMRLLGMWPQAEEEEEKDHLSAEKLNFAAEVPNDNPFAEFLARPTEEDDDAPSVERLKPKDPHEFFQIPKTSRSKKLRSRKAHKPLLAPETLAIAQLASLSVVEAGPSSKPSSTDDSKGDDGGSYFGVETGNVVEIPSNNYPYYSSISGSSNNFCSPEIEDWGNIKS